MINSCLVRFDMWMKLNLLTLFLAVTQSYIHSNSKTPTQPPYGPCSEIDHRIHLPHLPKAATACCVVPRINSNMQIPGIDGYLILAAEFSVSMHSYHSSWVQSIERKSRAASFSRSPLQTCSPSISLKRHEWWSKGSIELPENCVCLDS